MHSHHSHSGQYISHGSDKLDDIIEKAISMNFKIFCLTEHMPRYSNNLLYPEEIEKNYEINNLIDNFNNYFNHANLIQSKINNDNSNRTKILIGFEVEGGCGDDHLQKALELKKSKKVDLIVGSVHHVNSIDIDFDRPNWLKALANTTENNSIRQFFYNYFKIQQKMLITLKPEVVGHFDLIRLFLSDDDKDEDGELIKDINIELKWPEVWQIINENIDLIISSNSLIELNSSAIRKGWNSPYPKLDIAKLILQKGGKFCLSDDSHGLKQIGLNYLKVLNYCINDLKLDTLYYWDLNYDNNGNKLPFINSISLDDAKLDPFWDQYK